MASLSIRVSQWISWFLDALQLRVCRRIGYQSRWVETSVGRVHALCYEGEGTLPPLLLVHGLSSSAQDFEPLLRKVRGPFRQVVAIDLPGHGLSFRSATPPSAADMRTALAEAAEYLLEAPAVVYGNSLGGYASLCLHFDRPKCVEGLVLASPGGAPMTPPQLLDVLGVFRMRTHREAVAFMHRIMETRSWMTPLMAQACLGRLTRPHMRPMLEAIGSAKLLTPEDVASVSVPTVVIWGTGERLLPQSVHDFFLEHLPDSAQFEYPERAGHVPHSDRPGHVGRRLEALADLWTVGAEAT